MMEKVKALILPIAIIITLTAGNYLRLTDMEMQSLQDAIYAVGTGVLAIIGIYSVARKKKDDKDPK